MCLRCLHIKNRRAVALQSFGGWMAFTFAFSGALTVMSREFLLYLALPADKGKLKKGFIKKFCAAIKIHKRVIKGCQFALTILFAAAFLDHVSRQIP